MEQETSRYPIISRAGFARTNACGEEGLYLIVLNGASHFNEAGSPRKQIGHTKAEDLVN